MFNLKLYIKRNVLNEKLQSDILINEILNDPSKSLNYFYDLKSQRDSEVKKRSYTYNFSRIGEIVRAIAELNDNEDFKKTNKIYGFDLSKKEDFEKFLDFYKDIINEYKSYIKSLFTKPQSNIISLLALSDYSDTYNELDLYHITDSNFSDKIKYSMLREYNEELRNDINKELNNSFVFWFFENKEISHITSKGKIRACNVNIKGCCKYWGGYSNNSIKELAEEEKKKLLLKSFIKIPIYNGKTYNLPIYFYSYFVYSIMNSVPYYSSSVQNTIDIFNNTDKNLYHNNSGWGKNENDYFIIYKPTELIKNINGNISIPFDFNDDEEGKDFTEKYRDNLRQGNLKKVSKESVFGYNELKNIKSNSYDSIYMDPEKLKRLDDYKTSYTFNYSKWEKDVTKKIRAKYETTKKCIEYGKKITLEDFKDIYQLCSFYKEIAETNYRKRVEKLLYDYSALNKIKQRKNTLYYDLLNKFKSYSRKHLEITSRIVHVFSSHKYIKEYHTIVNTYSITLKEIAILLNKFLTNIKRYDDIAFISHAVEQYDDIIKTNNDYISNIEEMFSLLDTLTSRVEEIINDKLD